MRYKMIINTRSLNRSSSIQDKIILSGQMLTNTIKYTPILTTYKNDVALDEIACLYRHTRACTGTDVPMETQGVSARALTVPRINFERAYTGNKVHIYKEA
jgi:hypothetical protein